MACKSQDYYSTRSTNRAIYVFRLSPAFVSIYPFPRSAMSRKNPFTSITTFASRYARTIIHHRQIKGSRGKRRYLWAPAINSHHSTSDRCLRNRGILTFARRHAAKAGAPEAETTARRDEPPEIRAAAPPDSPIAGGRRFTPSGYRPFRESPGGERSMSRATKTISDVLGGQGCFRHCLE